MDLFHLTTAGQDVIDAIEQEGLKPGPNSWRRFIRSRPMLGELLGEDVVWLTADPTIKQWQGILPEPDEVYVSLWRVVCAIPAQDPHLLRFRNLFGAPKKAVKLNPLINSTWLYFGVVPPHWIKDIQYFGTRPYSEKHST